MSEDEGKRPDTNDTLQREGEEGIRKRTVTKLKPKMKKGEKRLRFSRASQIKPEAVQWLWENRIPLGMLTIVAGNPGIGKTLALMWLIAAVTTGGVLPMGEGRAIRGRVIVLSAEDDKATTLVPRLIAAGADLDMVEILDMVVTDEGDEMFDLGANVELLKKKIEELGDVVLIIIDPLLAYIGAGGKVRGSDQVEMRGVLSPLKTMAEDTRVAVVGIGHFNKKVDVSNALMRVSDSIAIVAAARAVFAVVEDADSGRKLFLGVKANLSAPSQGLSYTIGVTTVGVDERTREAIVAPFVTWGGEYVETTANEAMQAEADNFGEKAVEARSASKFLETILKDGPVATSIVDAKAREEDISKRTLIRARKKMKVVSKKVGSSWFMSLSGDDRLPEGVEVEMPF